MLSDEEKKEMVEDSQSQSRRQAFAEARSRGNQPMTGEQYMQFLQSAQKFFPPQNSPKKIEGSMFKL